MNKKPKVFIIIVIILAVVIFIALKLKPKADSNEVTNEINPVTGTIQKSFSTTGTVLPMNRLEIKPPVPGRVENIAVKEGEKVKIGQTLALMSSTERAALLDAAQAKGPEQLKYWQDTYKPITLLSPIEGEVIVATIQPGQTVTTTDAIVVLSDHLIVRAQVDETDIGKVKLGQAAFIALDAYPENKIDAKVEHIYYESETVNNVTIYKVDLLPEKVPQFFRSGMNATINFIETSKDNALLLPADAVHKENEENYVFLKESQDKEPIRQTVTLGISDDKNVEILSGLRAEDTVVIKTKKFTLPTSNIGKNPFMPFGQKKSSDQKDKKNK